MPILNANKKIIRLKTKWRHRHNWMTDHQKSIENTVVAQPATCLAATLSQTGNLYQIKRCNNSRLTCTLLVSTFLRHNNMKLVYITAQKQETWPTSDQEYHSRNMLCQPSLETVIPTYGGRCIMSYLLS